MSATFKDWPSLKKYTMEGIVDFINYVCRVRDDDSTIIANLPNIYMRGRKVGKIPTSSVDVAATDNIGDFNYSAANGYFYILVDNAQWRRIALGVW